MFAPLFPRLYEGILHDVFIQKAAVAWDNAPSSRIMVSLLLPGPMEADQWLHTVRANRHMWSLQMTSHAAANQLATDIFMRRERRRLQARHIWEKIQPNWPLIEERVWTKHAAGLPYQALYTGVSFSKSIQKSLVGWKILTRDQTHTGSGSSGNAVEHGLRSKKLRSFRANGSALCLQRLDQMDVLSWQWIDCHERIVVQVWHTKQGIFRRKLPPDVRDDPMRGLFATQ